MKFNELKRFLKINKEGAIFGAIGGFITFLITKSAGLPQMAAVESTGVIDVLVGKTVDVLTIAMVKLGLFYVIIGAIIGLLIDVFYKPKR